MNEPKFRAWVKPRKRMYYVRTLYLPERQIELEGIPITRAFSLDDVELMQFTGMTDKTGKDVYEGDILYYDIIDVRGVVTWVNTGPGFVILNPEKSGAFVIHSEWEIIGNIHEHPELLRKVTTPHS